MPPRPVQKPSSFPGWAKAVLGIVAALVLIGGCTAMIINGGSGGGTGSSESSSAFIIRSCQDAIKTKLKDPDSAKFADDWTTEKNTSQPSSGKDGVFKATGSVNSKNGFGGYTGNEKWGCDVTLTNNGEHSSTSAYQLP